MGIPKGAKSRTIQFNVALVSIFGLVKAVGYDIPTEIIVPVQTLGNIFWRYMTTGSIAEK